MYTLTLIAQKGGTGKTTLGINLSVAAEAGGWHAALVDLDPQASAAGWGDHGGGEHPAGAAAPATRLDAALQAVRGHGADIAVIDTAPHSESAAAVAGQGLVVVPHRIGARVAFQHALTNGLGVLEHEPRGKAAAEIAALSGWVRKRLEG